VDIFWKDSIWKSGKEIGGKKMIDLGDRLWDKEMFGTGSWTSFISYWLVLIFDFHYCDLRLISVSVCLSIYLLMYLFINIFTYAPFFLCMSSCIIFQCP